MKRSAFIEALEDAFLPSEFNSESTNTAEPPLTSTVLIAYPMFTGYCAPASSQMLPANPIMSSRSAEGSLFNSPRASDGAESNEESPILLKSFSDPSMTSMPNSEALLINDRVDSEVAFLRTRILVK